MGLEKVLTLLALIFLLFGLRIGTVRDAIKYPDHTGAFNMTGTDYLMSKLSVIFLILAVFFSGVRIPELLNIQTMSSVAMIIGGFSTLGLVIFASIEAIRAKTAARIANQALDRAEKLETGLVEARNSTIAYTILGINMQKISGEKLGILNEEGIQMFESMIGSLVKSFGDFAVVDEVAVDLFRTVFTKEQFNIVFPGASYKKNTS